jgi:hypothetical protein
MGRDGNLAGAGQAFAALEEEIKRLERAVVAFVHGDSPGRA